MPDLHAHNSWSQVVDEVDPVELLEVQLCNLTAPFILVSRLRPALAASPARRNYMVNVSAMEGQFGRGYKGPGHPHTNMAKAALNMLTRTSAKEMLSADGILMTSVDTGWITDERPHPTKMRLADEGFHAPLDLVDGAARVYDPIVRGEAGEDVYGCSSRTTRPPRGDPHSRSWSKNSSGPVTARRSSVIAPSIIANTIRTGASERLAQAWLVPRWTTTSPGPMRVSEPSSRSSHVSP